MQYEDIELGHNTIEFAFISFLISKNKPGFLEILSHEGVFEIQNKDLQTIEVGRVEFIEWLVQEREKIEKLTYHVDECTGCKAGCQVILFNYGRFRVKPNNASELEKSGFYFTAEKDKITKIEFCNNFRNTSNNYVFQNNIERKLHTYMRLNKCTKEQAIQDIKENYLLYLSL